MLIRYCAAHRRQFGYPWLLGVRWSGWGVSTAGGLCEACREHERSPREADPYGALLIPAPVEMGPRTLDRRVVVATIAATAAALITTAALLVANPPDLIPSGGEPGLFSSGARLAEQPPSEPADPEMEQPAASRPFRRGRAVTKMVASRAAPVPRPRALVATPATAPAQPFVATPATQAP
jgi:hypothetical protein